MAWLLDWVPTLVLGIWFGIGVARDPRRFGLGILLVLAVGSAILTGLAQLGEAASDGSDGETMAVAIAMLVVLLLVVLVVAILGGFLVVNAFTMWRKEGLGLAPRISGLLGGAMVLYVVAGLAAAIFGLNELVGPLLLVGFPAAYLGFLFVSFLSYSLLYGWATRRFGRAVDAVVVLGSGLGGGERVTPLLAGRLERGRAVYEKSVAAGRTPVLVVSGGKGDEEHLAEADAMGNWLVERGFDDEALLRESQSRDTEQNLEFSAQMLEGRGDVVVATSNYHAFRAAIIMRKAGIPGYTVGCRTARYYWPSATVREFLAILLEHSRVNLVLLILLSLPMVIYLFNALTQLMGLT
ncbi:MAG TPA: YdcF family protein [Arachnia sp.]|nr:YdcF family protein [Arachnia sp.]